MFKGLRKRPADPAVLDDENNILGLHKKRAYKRVAFSGNHPQEIEAIPLYNDEMTIEECVAARAKVWFTVSIIIHIL